MANKDNYDVSVDGCQSAYIKGGPIKTVPLNGHYFLSFFLTKTSVIAKCQKAINFECVS